MSRIDPPVAAAVAAGDADVLDEPAGATVELFRDDATLLECEARIVAVDEAGIVLDRTVFYPVGGGQAGDAGQLVIVPTGEVITIADTRKHPGRPGAIAHAPAAESPAQAQSQSQSQSQALAACVPGARVLARADAARRRAHMRFHTATHLLCALVPHAVNGCSITAGYARLDFHMTEPLDKEALTAGIARLVAAAHPVRHRWISEEELDANPGLVRSMSVQPPRGTGRVRVVEIEGVDLQPCGGTHVANTRDIGAVVVTKIEKKSAMTRRVVLGFAEPG
jgi:misacylated tRNA(Ala) deacylase